VSSFDQSAFKVSLAAQMEGVAADDITLKVTPGSVSVFAIITPANAAIATTAQSALEALASSGTAAVSTALSVPVTNVQQPTLNYISLAPPSAPPAAGFNMLYVYVAAAGAVFVLVVVIVIFCTLRSRGAGPAPRDRRMSDFAVMHTKHRTSKALFKEYSKSDGDHNMSTIIVQSEQATQGGSARTSKKGAPLAKLEYSGQHVPGEVMADYI